MIKFENHGGQDFKSSEPVIEKDAVRLKKIELMKAFLEHT